MKIRNFGIYINKLSYNLVILLTFICINFNCYAGSNIEITKGFYSPTPVAVNDFETENLSQHYLASKIKEVVEQDNVLAKGKKGFYHVFEDSPITKDLKISDVSIYAPGDLNKIGKEGKTAWDSFAYAIQMGHNVWSHINAVQRANRRYDAGITPKMLVQERFDRVYFRDVVNDIFACDDRDQALKMIDDHSRFWMAIPGTRGATGKKTVNSSTYFDTLFDIEEKDSTIVEDGEFTDEQTQKLEDLEDEADV
jgi:hypothetical protein